MRCLFFLIVFSASCGFISGQTNKIQQLSVSQLFIWNTTTIYDSYSGTRSSSKTGNAWSYGTNANYSVSLTQKLFVTVGLGYFNQRFGVNRGFDFYEPNVVTGLFYTTKKYSYKSFTYFGGFGYQVKIKKENGKIIPLNSELRFSAIANFYNSFQQEFQHDFGANFLGNPNPQTRKNSYQYGTTIQLKAGIVRPVYQKFKIGLDLVLPVYNRLCKDEILKKALRNIMGLIFR